MPRTLPNLTRIFSQEIAKAEDFVQRLEAAHVYLSSGSSNQQIGRTALELAYELSFLRIFIAWEQFQEQTFARLLCGYIPRGRTQEPLAAGQQYRRTINDAELAILAGQQYRLWHNPTQVAARARAFFAGGSFELIIASNQAALIEFAAIRHRIAHAQDHARQEFDNATMSLASRRYGGARPGKFLRDWQRLVIPRRRWISVISSDLKNLAAQICP